jgi:hypothetical protein
MRDRASLLLRSEASNSTTASPKEVRERFQKCGVALTAYENGAIRLSAPLEGWEEEDGGLLRFALKETAPSSLTLARRPQRNGDGTKARFHHATSRSEVLSQCNAPAVLEHAHCS